MTALALVQFTLQSVFVALRDDLPGLAALHPLNGFAHPRARDRACRGSPAATAGARGSPRRDRHRPRPDEAAPMADAVPSRGWLLVAGTILGLAPVANPSLLRVWLVPRGAHRDRRRASAGVDLLNAGFAARRWRRSPASRAGRRHARRRSPPAALVAGIAPYAVAGVLWCAMLAIRSRVTPALAGPSTRPRLRGRPARRGARRHVRRVRPHDGRHARRARAVLALTGSVAAAVAGSPR